MALNTYTALQAAMASWLNRRDLTASIPDFITLCEADLRKVLLAKGTRVIDTITITQANLGRETLGSGIKSLEAITLDTFASDGEVQITNAQNVFYWRTQYQGATGVPRFAAIVNDQLLVAPTPDADYTANVVYDAELVPLAEAPSNWLLINHSDLYLYGSLLHSAPFLKDDPRLDVWRGIYDSGILKLEILKARAEFGANAPVGMPRKAL